MSALSHLGRCRSSARRAAGPFLRALSPVVALMFAAGCPSPAVKPDPLKTYKDEAASQPASAAASAEQELAFWKGRDDLIPSPEAQPAQALKLPPLRRFKLKNGLRVLVLPDQRLPLIGVRLLLRAGAIDEPATKVGLAEFTASMLRQGTKRMTADALSRTVDSAGAGVSASSDYELTSVRCSGRKQSTKLCLQLVADLVQRPTFPQKEMGEIRDRLMSAIKQVRDDPDSLASAHLDNLLYGDGHPAGRPMTEASLQRITRKDLQAFHKQRYVPSAAILAVSGDVDPAKLERLLRQQFNRWRGRPAPARKITRARAPVHVRRCAYIRDAGAATIATAGLGRAAGPGVGTHLRLHPILHLRRPGSASPTRFIRCSARISCVSPSGPAGTVIGSGTKLPTAR